MKEKSTRQLATRQFVILSIIVSIVINTAITIFSCEDCRNVIIHSMEIDRQVYKDYTRIVKIDGKEAVISLNRTDWRNFLKKSSATKIEDLDIKTLLKEWREIDTTSLEWYGEISKLVEGKEPQIVMTLHTEEYGNEYIVLDGGLILYYETYYNIEEERTKIRMTLERGVDEETVQWEVYGMNPKQITYQEEKWVLFEATKCFTTKEGSEVIGLIVFDKSMKIYSVY